MGLGSNLYRPGGQMKTTIQWLDAIKKARGLSSDYAVAKALGVTAQVISHYRNGRRAFDPYTAAKVAELVGVEPMQVIASVEAERARNDEQRAFWRRLAAAWLLPMCAAAGLATPAPSVQAASVQQVSNLHIMRTRARRRAAAASAIAELAAALVGPRRAIP